VLTPLRNLIRSLGAGGMLLHPSGKNDALDYRGSSAIGDNVELGFTLGRKKDDDERDRRYLRCWKCRPAPEPPRRWLRLSVERGQVYVDEAEPPEGGEPDRGGRPPDVREELRPRLIAALTAAPQTRADLARTVGRGPKDRSVGRVLGQLVDEGIAARTEVGWTHAKGWRNSDTPYRDVGGSATPRECNRKPALQSGKCGWQKLRHFRGQCHPLLMLLREPRRARRRRPLLEVLGVADVTEQLPLFDPPGETNNHDDLLEAIRAQVAEDGMSEDEIHALVADALAQLRPPEGSTASAPCRCVRALVLPPGPACVWCGRVP
jgi:hypothetical protein